MTPERHTNVIDRPELRGRVGVFADREDAGEVLAEMLRGFRGSDAIVFAIPAGGCAVAAPIAKRLGLLLDVAVTSKITPPFNTEVGYGAVAFDGTVEVDRPLAARLGLSEQEVAAGIEMASEKVRRRVRLLRRGAPLPDLSHRTAILVDDGLASGRTMEVAIQARRKAGAREIAVAVPTGHTESVERVAPEVAAFYCANLRGGPRYAVADAYREWSDLTDEEIVEILTRAR
jgi:putative phosphoribosyl transferase